MHDLKSILRNKDGNVTMMVALFLTVLLGAVGFAVDGASIRSHTSDLQIAADSAALAGAAKALDLSPLARGELAEQAFFANISEDTAGVVAGEPVIVFDDSASRVTVTAKAKPKLYLMGIFTGKKTADISIKSVSGYQSIDQRPISLALVLDVSGSMGSTTSDGRVKIDVLRSAANGLLDSVEDATTKQGKQVVDVYTSVSTYNHDVIETPYLEAGFATARNNISTLTAGGGTASTKALELSLDGILAHPERHSRDNREFIVFMTDGDNNNSDDDVFTDEFCTNARENGVTVYSVAFAAPDKGKQMLLKCASSDSDPAKKKKGKGVVPFGPGARPCDVALNSPVIFERCRSAKEGYYFDAGTATEFQEIFENIGSSIGDQAIRIVE